MTLKKGSDIYPMILRYSKFTLHEFPPSFSLTALNSADLKVSEEFSMCQSTFPLSPDAGLPLVPDDVRGEGVLDVDVEPEQVLLGVRVEVVVQLRRRRYFPPAKTEGRASVK